MSNITAKVNWITYYDEENFFAILACHDEFEKFSVLGYIANPIRGQEYSFNGEWSVHPRYGRQFKADDSKLVLPTSAEGIRSLLKSGAVKGIGPVMAEKIVDAFGEDSLDVLENSPDDLLSVKGIGKKNLEKIKNGWAESQEIVELQRFLQRCGVSTGIAAKIYKAYGPTSIKTVKENPYVLCDLWGVGFRAADVIARELNLSPTDPNRLRAGILYFLRQRSVSGHCYEDSNEVITRVSHILGVGADLVSKRLIDMDRDREGIVIDEEMVYLKSYYFAESGIARKLYEIQSYEGNMAYADIDYLEKKFGIEYDETQADAIKMSLKNKVSIITGGPGTGKTTIIRAIVSSFMDFGMSVLLASPTGRAAKRMSEVVGLEAKTIHRLLEYNPVSESFMKNEKEPLRGDVLVVDECSMIDVLLMNNLLKAVPESMNIVLVGDVDQLPSVGPGNVLSDMIDSGCFFVARLEKVFRQAEKSDIVVNAHRINKGKDVVLRGRDVKLIQSTDPKSTIIDMVKKMQKRGVDMSDVMVLAPMKKTTSGTVELNNALQETLNDGRIVKELKYTNYRLGDRVMQIRNDYNKGVFNGSLGVVKGYDDEDKVMTVEFDDLTVMYDNSELDEIMLAYAITIHKSQGSEFPIVIIPLSMEHKVMLQRNLIYTAFTRPSKELYLVGDEKALSYAIKNATAMDRRTKLKERIQKWGFEE